MRQRRENRNSEQVDSDLKLNNFAGATFEEKRKRLMSVNEVRESQAAPDTERINEQFKEKKQLGDNRKKEPRGN